MQNMARGAAAVGGALVIALVLGGRSVTAWPAPCDFMTGGGFILTTASGQHAEDKANFGVAAGARTDRRRGVTSNTSITPPD